MACGYGFEDHLEPGEGSTSFSFAVSISQAIRSQTAAPSSWPAKVHFSDSGRWRCHDAPPLQLSENIDVWSAQDGRRGHLRLLLANALTKFSVSRSAVLICQGAPGATC